MVRSILAAMPAASLLLLDLGWPLTAHLLLLPGAEEFEYTQAVAPKVARVASPSLELGPHQRRPRAQQPPRMRRHALSLVPWRDLEVPILLSSPPAAAAMQRARSAGRTANLQPQLFEGAGGSGSYGSLGQLPQSSSGGHMQQQQQQLQQRRQGRW